MFPVKGLSVSAEKLKVETEASLADAPSAAKHSRKRKRQGNSQNVTAANLADLWEKVIEHKRPSGPGAKLQSSRDGKRQKTEHESTVPANPAGNASSTQSGRKEDQTRPDGESETEKKKKKDKKAQRDSRAAALKSAEEDDGEWTGFGNEKQAQAPEPEPAGQVGEEQTHKKKKKQKPGNGTAEFAGGKKGAEHHEPGKKTPKEDTAPPAAPPAPSTAKLTPLQASMREKLISARFRHLNETLYTRPSAEAFKLFQDSPEMFTEYHEGFRRQVEVWPENPVDGFINDIKARAKARFPPRDRSRPVTPAQLPLPRAAASSKTCTIADLGCGDAKLAAALQPLKHKLHLDIRSFDLQTGGSPLVTRADMANLPLADGSVDVAIFCLALMGTNWLDFVEEAYRVLRWKGELWVAEIKSRFAGGAAAAAGKKGAPGVAVPHSVGNRKKGTAAAAATTAAPGGGGKRGKAGGGRGGKAEEAAAAEDEEANLAELAAQVDGVELRKQETDVSAFVEALRKRGFLLNRDLGDKAVDMSNKMFVRMHFVKAAPAVKGKCAVEGGKDGQAPAKKKKFIVDDEDEGGEGNEAAVLKPCVYKLR
ncbi:hypothetical protein VTK56DRAFT_6380 [Thermocarpiscus australiensis]